jgi:hypothetical protein
MVVIFTDIVEIIVLTTGTDTLLLLGREERREVLE